MRCVVTISIPRRCSAKISTAVVVWICPAIGAAVGPTVPTRNRAIDGVVIANASDVIGKGVVRALQQASTSYIVGVSLLVRRVLQRTRCDTSPKEILTEVWRRTNCHA